MISILFPRMPKKTSNTTSEAKKFIGVNKKASLSAGL
jgi:hypothetical protein